MIEDWLAGRLGHRVRVHGLTVPSGAGVSNETFLFSAQSLDDAAGSAENDEYVLRLHPSPDYQVFYNPEFRMQFDLLGRLHESGAVRVPRVFGTRTIRPSSAGRSS